MRIGKKRLLDKNWQILALIYVIAVIARITIVCLYSWNTGLHFETVQIARYLINGYGYSWDWYKMIPPQPTAILAPLYTYFIALFMMIFDEPARYIYIVQAVLNSLVIIPGYFLGKYYGGTKNGLILAIILGVFPEITYMPVKMVAEVISIVMVFLGIYLYLKYKDDLIANHKTTGFIWLGILLGIATLIKDNSAFIFLACFIGLLFIRINYKIWLKAAFLFGLAFTLTISPWLVRNYIVFDKPVFRTMYGFNLWRGNHPCATGTGRLANGFGSETCLDQKYLDYIEKNHPSTELGIDKFYKDEAIKFIKADKMRYAELTLKRLFYFIVIDPTHPLTKSFVYISGYIFTMVFGIWGGIILYRRKKLDRIYILLPILFIIAYVPVIIIPRYRLILIWLLLILSSISITGILSRGSLPFIGNRIRKAIDSFGKEE